jgi:hypothetical protein
MGKALGRVLRRGSVALVMGAAMTWGVAWWLAVYRPTDGYPNIFRTNATEWNTKYRVPQFRAVFGGREVFVDCMGSAGSWEISYAPVWVRNLGEEDQWLFTTYPLAADLRPEVRRVFEADGWNGRFDLPGWAPLPAAESKDWQVSYSAWGWPAPCLVSRHRQWDTTPTGPRRTIAREDSWAVEWFRGWTNGRVRGLPARVVWTGFAVDTLVFAAVAYTGVWGVGTVRRARRRLRGACVGCGYSREGLAAGAACPECGAGGGKAGGAPTAAGGVG